MRRGQQHREREDCWMKDVVGVELAGDGGNDTDGKEMIIFFGDEVLSWTPRILLSSLVGGEESTSWWETKMSCRCSD